MERGSLKDLSKSEIALEGIILRLFMQQGLFDHPFFRKHLTTFNCSYNSLEVLPNTIGNCVALQDLDCSNNRLQVLPDVLGNCTALKSLHCSSNELSALPDAIGNCTALQDLDCSSNRFQVLPDILGNYVALHTLRCSNNSLQALPDVLGNCTALQYLHCFSNRIQVLPDSIGNCIALDYLDCFGNDLQALPNSIGNCRNLNTLVCFKNRLQALPSSIGNCLALQSLNCSENMLQVIPDSIGNCIALQRLCCFSNRLQALPDSIVNCMTLYHLDCSNNGFLVQMPAFLPSCVYLNCLDCPLIQALPQLPFIANITSPQSGPSRLAVDIEKLKSDPKKYLVELGKNFLLQGRPFPSVDYFEDGKLSQGVDAGGLRRDFLTRLFQGLFLEQEGTLPVIRREGGVWPGMDQNLDTVVSYRTIARVMALCYQDVVLFKIGDVFTSMLFSAVKVPDIAECTDEAFIEAFLLTRGYLLNSYKGTGDLGFKELRQVKALGYNGKSRAGLRQYLLDFAKEDGFLQVVSLIAQELRVCLRDKWLGFISEDVEVLQGKIQGVFNKNLLLHSINWKTSGSVASTLAKNKKFFNQWVELADEEIVRSFLQAVTGNRVLGPGCGLSIRLYDDGSQGAIPHCHACSQELELPATYANQEIFNKKMNDFVAHALAGTGFQVS